MTGLLLDLRSSLRAILRQPGFPALAIALVAVAVGANTVVFAVIDAVLLQALPYPRPDHLVELSLSLPPADGLAERQAFLDRATLEAWAESSRTLSGVAPWKRLSMTLESGGRAERVTAAAMTPELLSVLGVSPILGPGPPPAAGSRGTEPTVLLDHDLWQRRFGGRRDVLGRLLRLDGSPHRVVGVLPAGFAFPDEEVQLWTTLDSAGDGGGGPAAIATEYLAAIGRLAPSAGIVEAEAEGDSLLLLSDTERGGGGRVRVVPLAEATVASVRSALIAVWLAAGLVLLAACGNLAGLLLARGAAKRRELAVRGAVGARRTRLVQRVLIDSLLLSLTGGALGVLLSLWASRLLPRLAPLAIPRLEAVAIDGRTLFFALLLSVVAGLLCGALPAIRSTAASGFAALRGGAAEEGAGPIRLRRLLIGAQVAMAVGLLIASALLVRSFVRLVTVEPGYEPRRALVAELDLDAAGPEAGAQIEPVLERLVERLAAHDGIEAVGVTSFPPLAESFAMTSLAVVGGPPGRTLAVPQRVDPGLLRAAGLRLAEGRWLRQSDHAARAAVAVVNRTFAARFLGGARAVGRQVVAGTATLEVVGVVEDVRLLGRAQEPKPEIYLSYRSAADALGGSPGPVVLVVRTAADPDPLIPFLRSAARQAAPGIPLVGIEKMEEQLAASAARPRFYALALSCLAGAALFLTALGLYGLFSHEVARQTRAIGIRRAVGAEGWQVAAPILRPAAGVVAAGVVAGWALAAGASRLLAALLFGVAASDPVAYAAALGVVLLVAAVACGLPARRAARVDPLEALRSD